MGSVTINEPREITLAEIAQELASRLGRTLTLSGDPSKQISRKRLPPEEGGGYVYNLPGLSMNDEQVVVLKDILKENGLL